MQHFFPLNRADLDEVVARNDKNAFPSTHRHLIRANQGHVEVDFLVEPQTCLHGTGEGAVEAIMQMGLCKMLHLSSDMTTARTVGAGMGILVLL